MCDAECIFAFPFDRSTERDQLSMRSDMLLINMEERARQRSALKTEREARRRAIEEEKLAKVQRKETAKPRAHFLIACVYSHLEMMEEKIRQEDEEKRSKAEEVREKRRLDKEREIEKKQFEERLQMLTEKADAHCR